MNVYAVTLHFEDGSCHDIFNVFASKEAASVYIKEEIVNWMGDYNLNTYNLKALRQHWIGDINKLIEEWNCQSIMSISLDEMSVHNHVTDKHHDFPFDMEDN
jgi:hypothetical protein